jgi:hypothetical protein
MVDNKDGHSLASSFLPSKVYGHPTTRNLDHPPLQAMGFAKSALV